MYFDDSLICNVICQRFLVIVVIVYCEHLKNTKTYEEEIKNDSSFHHLKMIIISILMPFFLGFFFSHLGVLLGFRINKYI